MKNSTQPAQTRTESPAEELLSPRARVTRQLRDMIQKQFVHAEDMPSERVLAQQLGVSRDTVRAALQRLADEGLITPSRARSRRSVTPTRPEAGIMARTVALLSTEATDIQELSNAPSGWDKYLQYHITLGIQQSNLYVLNVNQAILTDEALDHLIASRPACCVATYRFAASDEGRAILTALHEAGIRVIANGTGPELARYDTVYSDHRAGSHALTRWLMERGCRRIQRFWRFSSPRPWIDQRNLGYEQALADSGLQPLPAVHTPDMNIDDRTREGFDQAVRLMAGYLMEAFARTPDIDALMVATDQHVYQVAASLRLIGKDPAHYRIVGYDNVYQVEPARQWEPTLPSATVDRDNLAQAGAMVNLVQQYISQSSIADAPPEPSHICMVPRLVVIEPAPSANP